MPSVQICVKNIIYQKKKPFFLPILGKVTTFAARLEKLLEKPR